MLMLGLLTLELSPGSLCTPWMSSEGELWQVPAGHTRSVALERFPENPEVLLGAFSILFPRWDTEPGSHHCHALLLSHFPGSCREQRSVGTWSSSHPAEGLGMMS